MKEAPENQVLINYLLGICTPKELDDVERWLSESSKNVAELKKVLAALSKTDYPRKNIRRAKKRIFRQIESDLIATELFAKPVPEKEKNESFSGSFNNHLVIKTVALITVFIIAGFFTFKVSTTNHVASQQEPQFQERQLSYGQTSTFRFDDGSVITLNGGSTLSYPKQFDPDIREVYLEGEAFFDIAPDKNRPFIVHVGSTTTHVLGTSFNIKAYENDDKMQVTVIEGTVAVSRKAEKNGDNKRDESVILQKNQWATYHQNGKFLEQGEGNTWEQIAWKDQVLVFNDKPFSDVAVMLERWYGVEIILTGEKLQHAKLEGEHKNMSLERVLQSIQFVLGIEYTIEDQVVRIQASDK